MSWIGLRFYLYKNINYNLYTLNKNFLFYINMINQNQSTNPNPNPNWADLTDESEEEN